MKEGWEIRTLGEVCDILDKLRKPITKSNRVVGDYPYYGATGILSYVDDYIFSEDLVLLGEDGAKWGVGERSAFLATGKYWVNNHAHVLRPKRNILEYNWLIHYLNGNDITPFVTGMTVPKLTQEKMRSIPIPLPSLLEQQRIVSIIDKAFEAIDKAIENTQKNLQNAKELFESYLNSVFENGGEGWEIKTLNQISENLDSKRVPITKNVRRQGSIPYYGASGIVDYIDDYLFDEDLLCVSEDGANLLARTYPIAFSINGKAWVNNHAHVLRFNNYDSQKFVELYLNSIKLDDFVSGMAQPKLNQAMLNKIPIPFPSIDIQQLIVHKLETFQTCIDNLETQYQQKLRDLEELKKSILNKAFAGDL